MCRVAIVRVDHVTGGTARGAIIAGMIVRAEKIQCWVEQSCFLYSEKDRIRALCSAKAACAESFVRLAGIFFFVRQTDFESSLAAALKHAQDVSGLRNLPTRNRIQQAQETFGASLFFRARLQQCLRLA